MKIPFVGPFYQARSQNADAQRAVNCYLEMDEASPRAPLALYGTPGTVLRFQLGAAPVRGGKRQDTISFWVGGDSVFKVALVAGAYVVTKLGTIGTSTGAISMASNGTEMLIVDGVAGWLATAGGLVQITDPEFPNGVTRAEYQDGFFIVTGDGTGKFYINENPNDGLAWNGTDFASAEGSPDDTVGLISSHRELWLFGSDSTEVWVNTGNADFPFERSGNTFMEQGCAAAATVDKLDNTVYWLAQNDRGGAIVLRAQGYSPVRISNHALEQAMQGYETLSDAFAYSFQIEGHFFYVLTFPTADVTWVYDASTGQWFQWAWRDRSTNEIRRHRSSCHVFFNDEHLVGDFENSNVYGLAMDAYTDNGDPILRLRTTQTFADLNDYAQMFFEELIVDMERGVGIPVGQGEDPKVMLRYFDFDRGEPRWSNLRTRTIGGVGRGGRVKFGPMGSGRDRIWELSMTDPVKFAVFGAMARITKGD